MKKILITGASQRAFVGKVIKQYFSNTYEIYAPNRTELDLTNGDTVFQWLKKHPVDVIIHCAVHIPMNHGTENELENDLRMFFNLERCKDFYGHLIHFGTGAEYDKRLPLENVKESQIGRSIPTTPYGFSKYIINQYTRKNNNITNLRLFGIFGKDENWRVKLISGLCYKAVFGLPLTVRHHCLFDFMDIEDLLPVVSLAIEGKLKQRDYNVCTGKAVDIYYIAKRIQTLSGGASEVKLLNNQYDLPYTASNTLLLKDFPKMQFTPLDVSIKRLLDWFEYNKKNEDYNVLMNIL